MTLSKGCVQVYTGNGKGKTTAAVGLAVRAAGDGLKVYMVQFLKGGKTGELESAKKLYPNFNIFRFEKKRGFFWILNDEEKKELKSEIDKAMQFCFQCLEKKECDILILDEIMGAMTNGLVEEETILELLNKRPQNIEIILTGRNVPQSILDAADLVTEMKEIKHYFSKGIPAREGIEY